MRLLRSWVRPIDQIRPVSFQVNMKLQASVLSILVSIFRFGLLRLSAGIYQRWSRGHKARGQGQGQGHKKNPRPRPRPRTAFPRTDTLEAKDRNARGQGQGPRTQSASALQKKKKKKRSSQKFFKRSPRKNAFQKIFQPLHKILTFRKIVLSSSRGQANFRGLEASRPRPRPRTSKSVLEDVLEAKDVLEDSTSGIYEATSSTAANVVSHLEQF